MIVSIASMAVGEMFASPRIYEYIGAIAPKGQEGLYLGYAKPADRPGQHRRRADRRAAVRALHPDAAQGRPAGRHRDHVARSSSGSASSRSSACGSTTGRSSRARKPEAGLGYFFLAAVPSSQGRSSS
ncbi:MAG: hypothetical protein M0C28_07295 [Candidatus Moduliflexus flocculans]|nr:hypothetical protein [Candidatus Moduliflexus flocculans]